MLGGGLWRDTGPVAGEEGGDSRRTVEQPGRALLGGERDTDGQLGLDSRPLRLSGLEIVPSPPCCSWHPPGLPLFPLPGVLPHIGVAASLPSFEPWLTHHLFEKSPQSTLPALLPTALAVLQALPSDKLYHSFVTMFTVYCLPSSTHLRT